MSDCDRLPVPASNSLAESFGPKGFKSVIVASAGKDDRPEGDCGCLVAQIPSANAVKSEGARQVVQQAGLVHSVGNH